MDTAFTIILYAVAGVLLAASAFKDKQKTLLSLKRAWKMFLSVLPQFMAIVLFVGMFLAVVKPETIRQVIGAQSGFLGMLVSSLIGAVTLVPVLIAFPIAAELLRHGAGVAQMAVFISTLTTVGAITLPLESRYLGRKAAVLRNTLFYLFSFASAYIIGMVMA